MDREWIGSSPRHTSARLAEKGLRFFGVNARGSPTIRWTTHSLADDDIGGEELRKPSQKVVEAECFVLKDSQGKERARLDVDNGIPTLSMTDEADRIRLCLAVYDSGPSVALYDTDEEIRALLKVLPTGPNLSLFKHEGRVMFGNLTVSRDGKPLRVEQKLRPQIELTVGPEGPAVAVYGLEQSSRALITAEDHGAALALHAPDEKSRVEIHADVKGAEVLLFGADGRPVRSIH